MNVCLQKSAMSQGSNEKEYVCVCACALRDTRSEVVKALLSVPVGLFSE